jgi:site-specific DNA recombinase
MVFDEAGERLTPTHAVKKGARYRYYVSTPLVTGTGKNRCSGRRIPAGNLEGLVINRLRTLLADPGAILEAIESESHTGSEQAQLIARGRQIAHELGGEAPDQIKALLTALLCRVEIHSDRVDFTLSRRRLTELLDDEIRLDSGGEQNTKHADLDRAETSSARKYECRLMSGLYHTSPL